MDLSIVERYRFYKDQGGCGKLAAAVLVLAHVVEKSADGLPSSMGRMLESTTIGVMGSNGMRPLNAD
jgi:hypothetical protein